MRFFGNCIPENCLESQQFSLPEFVGTTVFVFATGRKVLWPQRFAFA